MITQDLRIGNYVWDDYSGEMIVSAILESSAVYLRKTIELPSGQYLVKDIQPIPLTEDWLKKFGYEWSIFHQAFHKEGFAFDLNEWDKGIYSLTTFKRRVVIRARIDYVHTLQNLIHALTGEELTIKNQ